MKSDLHTAAKKLPLERQIISSLTNKEVTMRKALFVITLVLAVFAFSSPISPPVTGAAFPDHSFVQSDACQTVFIENISIENYFAQNFECDVSVVQNSNAEYPEKFVCQNMSALNDEYAERVTQTILSRHQNKTEIKYGSLWRPPTINLETDKTDIVLLC